METKMPLTNLLVLVPLLSLASCRSDPEGQNPTAVPRLSYVVAVDDEGITFLLGRQGITDELPRILDGEKVGQQWTLLRVGRDAADPSTLRAEVDLSRPGVDVAHEFRADNPYTEAVDHQWYRIDFSTDARATNGRLLFNRSGDPDSRVEVEVEYEGESDVYEGPSPTHVKFGILTGFALAQPQGAP